jgi:hypothetical protein
VFILAFDLIELNGNDLRRDPLAVRKATLASLVAHAAPGLRLNEHLDHDDGALVFEHACRLGLEGIVSKRRASLYRSGCSRDSRREARGRGRLGQIIIRKREICCRDLLIYCGSGRCHHGAAMNADWLPDETPALFVGGWSRCGYIGADVRPDQAARLSGLTSAFGSIRR